MFTSFLHLQLLRFTTATVPPLCFSPVHPLPPSHSPRLFQSTPFNLHHHCPISSAAYHHFTTAKTAPSPITFNCRQPSSNSVLNPTHHRAPSLLILQIHRPISISVNPFLLPCSRSSPHSHLFFFLPPPVIFATTSSPLPFPPTAATAPTINRNPTTSTNPYSVHLLHHPALFNNHHHSCNQSHLRFSISATHSPNAALLLLHRCNTPQFRSTSVTTFLFSTSFSNSFTAISHLQFKPISSHLRPPSSPSIANPLSLFLPPTHNHTLPSHLLFLPFDPQHNTTTPSFSISLITTQFNLRSSYIPTPFLRHPSIRTNPFLPFAPPLFIALHSTHHHCSSYHKFANNLFLPLFSNSAAFNTFNFHLYIICIYS